MLALCAAQLDPTDNPALETSIKHWLRGELRLISEVKRALIFQKVARHNARHMLFSLAHWLTLTGKSWSAARPGYRTLRRVGPPGGARGRELLQRERHHGSV